MDLYPIKLTPTKDTPLAGIVGLVIVGFILNLALLIVSAAAIGLGLKIGLGL